MRFGFLTRGTAVVSLAAAAAVAVPGRGAAQSSKARPAEGGASASKASAEKERASGVIVKVESVKKGDPSGPSSDKGAGKGGGRAATHRLTVNTNAVWRDWARDQSRTKDSGPPRKDAAAGKNSIATRGEPADANSLVVVDVGPETRVETRFRSSEDETGKGSKTPEGAQPDGARSKGKGSAEKSVRFHAGDLKPGLFVEVDFRHVDAGNPASAVTVIRPIGGPDSGSADRPKSADK